MAQQYPYGSYDQFPPSGPYSNSTPDHTAYRQQQYGGHQPEYPPPSTEDVNSSYYQPPDYQPHFYGQHRQQGLHGQDSDAASAYQHSEYSSSVYALNPNTYQQERYHDSEHDNMPMSQLGQSRPMEEKRAVYASPKKKKKAIIIVVVVGAILLAAGAVIPLYIFVIKPNLGKSGSSGSSGSSGGKASSAVTGGDGSQVVLADGTNMAYANPFGGRWYYDPNDPFNSGAQAQSWTPALNETFNYGKDKIRGVNLGGWLVIEPFIAPALFQKYPDQAVDEYTLHTLMSQDTANGGFDQLEAHYNTFITEQDFAEIAAAGLNYVRIPFPFWAIETIDGEPYYAKGVWKYFLKAIAWARKYGIRINLDFHSHPGSQNGWDHSGKRGDLNWLVGPMGLANAQRSLNYIRIIAEFISQPQYRDVVTMFGVVNEPRAVFMGNDILFAFYAEAYKVVREASGIGKGPYISMHDGFMSRDDFVNFLPNADRVALDSHPYIAFGDQTEESWATRTGVPCGWGKDVNKSMSAFGLTVAGEFSNAINDCALYLNGVGKGVRFEGTSVEAPNQKKVGSGCGNWTNWEDYTDDTKDGIKKWAMASMDGLQNFFFWTWKIGNSSESGRVESPFWSYQLGLENGWMPKDPREADNFCKNTAPFTGTITPGSGQISTAKYPWPPAAISSGGAGTKMITYTATGTLPTLTGGTLSVSGLQATKTVDVGSGWNNQADNAQFYVPVKGCNYLDPYIGPSHPLPAPLCNAKREEPPSGPTPAPNVNS